MLLGCIGDDFTGSSDLGNTLAKEGMRVVQYVGTPDRPASPDVEAGIVSLKSRTIPAAEAVAQSLAALDWLKAQGCEQFFFKYCSTFDSTPEGNIGPVAEALTEALGADQVIVCPAFPATGRSVYEGHLFVNDQLLSESGMAHHPLTPMTDPDIRRCLRAQTDAGVGHVNATTVRSGADAIRAALHAEKSKGATLIVVDAIEDDDLRRIGAAADGLKLVTGGSGVSLGLPENFRRAGKVRGGDANWSGTSGPAVVLSGSCSIMTRAQVARYRASNPHFEINVDEVIAAEVTADSIVDWVKAQSGGVPLIYSSADPEVVAAAQERHGRERASEALEGLVAAVARKLADDGFTRIVTAGGETSGAIVSALDARELEIGPEIAPGVPALKAGRVRLALKSGNFGDEDFFDKALSILTGGAS